MKHFLFSQGTPILLGQPNLPLNDCNFIGREKETKEIVSLLKSQSTRFVSIYGPPGSGKSEAAIAVAHNLKSEKTAVYFSALPEVDSEDVLASRILRFLATSHWDPYSRSISF